MRPWRWLLLTLGLLLSLNASARVALYEGDDVQLYYGGYVRSLTSWQSVDEGASFLYQANGFDPESFALQSIIARSEIKFSALDLLTLELHGRYALTFATEPIFTGGGLIGAGAGVSQPPTRSLDLSAFLWDSPKGRFETDVDRLVLRFYLGDADLSIGRQAITWGNSTLFSVSDIWSSFSPFDLDTSQKRGTDAIRAVWALNQSVELDFILADRGSVEDLSGGIRALFYLSFGELYVGAAKTYEDVALGLGLSADIHTVKLRGEVMGRYDTERSEFELPRATLGVDWFYSDAFMWGVELHLNGFGTLAESDAEYVSHVASEGALLRGEGYLMGLAYAGTYLSYRPHDLVTLSTSALVNLLDPSALLNWALNWEVLESVDLSMGAYHGLGSGFEFGLSGHMIYLQVAAYF